MNKVAELKRKFSQKGGKSEWAFVHVVRIRDLFLMKGSRGDIFDAFSRRLNGPCRLIMTEVPTIPTKNGLEKEKLFQNALPFSRHCLDIFNDPPIFGAASFSQRRSLTSSHGTAQLSMPYIARP